MKTRLLQLVLLLPLLVATAVASAQTQCPKQLSELPTLYITTAGEEPVESKVTYIDCTIVRVEGDSIATFDDATIRARGNSTLRLEKKPYRLKFATKKRLLGPDRANAKSWTLLANHSDKSLLRNATASFIGAYLGQTFVAGAQFADLVLNGRYLGTYQISDQINVNKKRVNITEQKAQGTPDADTDNVSGGYLFEVDGIGFQEQTFFTSPLFNVPIVVKSPDEEVIDSRHYEYIRNYFTEFESALEGSQAYDPVRGYRQYVDSVSLASWYLASEYTASPDTFWSFYFYKQKDDKRLFWGPLWDYDIAFNNCERLGDTSDDLMIDRAFQPFPNGEWFMCMNDDPWFRRLIARAWNDAVGRGLEEATLSYVDSLARVIDSSQRLNYALYPIDQRNYDEYLLFSTYEEYVAQLKDFIRGRTAFLTESFAADTPPSPDPDPEPDPEPGHDINTRYYHSITNYGVGMLAGVYGSDVAVTTLDASDSAAQWELRPAGNGCYTIRNRRTELYATDMADEPAYRPGNPLQAFPELTGEDALRQRWKLIAVPGEASTFIIENPVTGLAWNNGNGNATDGNRILSWTSDSQNFNKINRKWIFRQAEPIEESAIDSPGAGTYDYAVTYSPSLQALRFTAYSDAPMSGSLEIYSMAGVRLLAADIAPEVSLSALAPGCYIVVWRPDGNPARSLRFRKP